MSEIPDLWKTAPRRATEQKQAQSPLKVASLMLRLPLTSRLSTRRPVDLAVQSRRRERLCGYPREARYEAARRHLTRVSAPQRPAWRWAVLYPVDRRAAPATKKAESWRPAEYLSQRVARHSIRVAAFRPVASVASPSVVSPFVASRAGESASAVLRSAACRRYLSELRLCSHQLLPLPSAAVADCRLALRSCRAANREACRRIPAPAARCPPGARPGLGAGLDCSQPRPRCWHPHSLRLRSHPCTAVESPTVSDP